jgi:hypothetical protein
MEDIMINAKSSAAALAAACAIAVTTPAISAPVMASASVLKQAAGGDVEQVRWRGRGAAAAGIGFAAGALVGSAIASSNRGYYSEPYGYYGAPAYGSGYYAADTGYYAAPAPRYYNRGYYGGGVNDYCARYDSSGVNRFDNCY